MVSETIEQVARHATVRVHEIGGAQLVSASDAPTFLNACLASHARVLGVEGFHATGETIQPDLDMILDLSDVDDFSVSVAEAREFVAESTGQDVYFEFVLR